MAPELPITVAECAFAKPPPEVRARSIGVVEVNLVRG